MMLFLEEGHLDMTKAQGVKLVSDVSFSIFIFYFLSVSLFLYSGPLPFLYQLITVLLISEAAGFSSYNLIKTENQPVLSLGFHFKRYSHRYTALLLKQH